ncbi:hypothetical protein BPAE_0013g00880 [Botrytis paeoniae]|uniref:Zn(2)-C6 fungal-type domain-containing protein n=1 Tax=Botrytis paeoniae TaxID=278948 RepID=A0A4Z1FYM9_9HELO|nr:hypothetical protein BPAE_0013g00880 [Botrytis paeoniae]
MGLGYAVPQFRRLVDVVVLDRSRHVKCDESNPICQKCLVGGFDCIYQSLVGPRKGILNRMIAPKGRFIVHSSIGREFWSLQLFPQSNELLAKCYSFTTSPTLKSPQTLSFDHETQYQYFEFFKNKNASLLSGYFDTDFWERLVFQLCHQEESVKHAVVALGSLARNIEVNFDAPLSNNSRYTAPSEHYLFVLREYSKFLRLARRNTNKVVEAEKLQSILVSCVLTSIFELYQGRQEASIKTVVSGLKIISSVREQHVLKNTLSIWSLGINIDLLALFIRWEQGFLLFMPSQPPFAPHGSLQDLEDTISSKKCPWSSAPSNKAASTLISSIDVS